MDVRTSCPLRFGAPKDLPSDRCDLSDAEQEEPEQVHDRVALGPFEVDVRSDACAVADVD